MGQARARFGPDFIDYLSRTGRLPLSRIFAAIYFHLTGDGEPRLVTCTAPSEQFLSMLGIGRSRPAMSREYLFENDTLIVSYQFWANQPAVIHVISRVIHFRRK
jgi:hypothetical protein